MLNSNLFTEFHVLKILQFWSARPVKINCKTQDTKKTHRPEIQMWENLKDDFLKRPIKRRILTQFLGFFWPDINLKKFKNIIFRLNSTRAIDWCMNCHSWIGKIFDFFFGKGPVIKGHFHLSSKIGTLFDRKIIKKFKKTF